MHTQRRDGRTRRRARRARARSRHRHGFSGFIFNDTGGAVIFNLYTNPEEDVVVGVRHIPMAVPLGETAGWYLKELFEYPPQFKVGFMSNNPPVYDVLPVGEMAIKAWLQKHGFGRQQH